MFFRTDNQVRELTSVYQESPQAFAEAEGRRMDKVVASFRIYRFAYIVSGIAALALVGLTRRPGLNGAAVGLFIFTAMGFAIDHFAEERAVWYAEKVHAQAGPLETSASAAHRVPDR